MTILNVQRNGLLWQWNMGHKVERGAVDLKLRQKASKDDLLLTFLKFDAA